jgi:lysophospholipase L1-like esterase
MHLKRLLILLIVFIELVAGFYIIGYFYHKYIIHRALSIPQIEPIQKKTLIFPDGKLKYYYEPKPNETESDAKPKWLSYQPVYTINSDGLNSINNHTVEKFPNTFRIIALGDSFTFGMWVNTPDSWPAILEKKLNTSNSCNQYNKIEVLNLGVKGYDIQYEVERFRRHGEKYNPDLVIWLLHDNDFTEIEEQLRTYEHEAYDKLPQGTDTLDFDTWRMSKIGNFIQQLNAEFGKNRIVDQNYSYLKNITNYYGGPLIITSLPNIGDTYINLMKRFATEREKTMYFSLRDIYDDKYKATFNPDDFHPNQKGHQMIAEDIYNYLVSNKIICK